MGIDMTRAENLQAWLQLSSIVMYLWACVHAHKVGGDYNNGFLLGVFVWLAIDVFKSEIFGAYLKGLFGG